MTNGRPCCEDYMRMPLSEAVLDHIRSRDKRSALLNQLVGDLDRRARGFEHWNRRIVPRGPHRGALAPLSLGLLCGFSDSLR